MCTSVILAMFALLFIVISLPELRGKIPLMSTFFHGITSGLALVVGAGIVAFAFALSEEDRIIHYETLVLPLVAAIALVGARLLMLSYAVRLDKGGQVARIKTMKLTTDYSSEGGRSWLDYEYLDYHARSSRTLKTGRSNEVRYLADHPRIHRLVPRTPSPEEVQNARLSTLLVLVLIFVVMPLMIGIALWLKLSPLVATIITIATVLAVTIGFRTLSNRPKQASPARTSQSIDSTPAALGKAFEKALGAGDRLIMTISETGARWALQYLIMPGTDELIVVVLYGGTDDAAKERAKVCLEQAGLDLSQATPDPYALIVPIRADPKVAASVAVSVLETVYHLSPGSKVCLKVEPG